MQRVVLAYGGSAAASTHIRQLVSDDAEVVTLTLDAGAGQALEAIRDRALAAGAVRAHVLDVREEFAREYLLPALRAGALVIDGRVAYPALMRALVERKLAEIAALEGAARIEAPPPPGDGPVPDRKPGTSATPAQVEIAFVQGAPMALNGVTMPLLDLIGSLGTIAGEHGVAPEPAATVLAEAHATLVTAAVAPDLGELCVAMRGRYAAAIRAGRWSSPLREALDAFFTTAQRSATGAVRVKLFKGEYAAVGVIVEGSHDYSLVGPV